MRITLVAALCAILSPLVAGAQPLDEPRIVVSGVGEVTAPPDMATISLGVEHEAPSATEALERTSADMRAVLEALRDAGIDPRDIQTSNLALQPRREHRDNGEGRIIGFFAVNTATVRVRELDRLGEILDVVAQSGGNSFRDLSFALEDPSDETDEARRRAVAEARDKAELLAEAGGVGLGRIIEITETGGGGPVMMRMEQMAMSDGVPVAEGEITLREEVQITFRIEEAR